MVTAMLCAATVTAQLVAGKATRDALFLTSLDFTALPMMLIATSAFSILLVALNARGARRIAPATLVPVLFVASGLLFLLEWLLRSKAPAVAAVVIYLHISGAGPLLASGFWLIASERFDPRTAKRRFGQIAGAGTLGGLLSAVLAERVAAMFGAPAMLPFLAALHLITAWLVRRLAESDAAGLEGVRSPEAARKAAQIETAAPIAVRSGLRVVAGTPYLRHLAALVLFGTTSAALVDYLFKAQAVEMFGRGDPLLRFFALYYAATSLITFILQTSSSRMMLERFGLAVTTGMPSGALLVGSLGSLVAPGFASLLVARGGESVFRSSWFRAGYELSYTPLPAAEKRAAKSLIDVAFDRLGEAAGGGLVRLTVLLLPAAQSSAILSFAVACSAGAVFAASRLNRGYIGSLSNSLIDRAGGIDTSDDESDRTTQSVMRQIFEQDRLNAGGRGRKVETSLVHPRPTAPLDAEVRDILHLRSRDRERIVAVLSRSEGLSAGLVAHTIPLLAWQPVADHAQFALRKVAEEHVGELVDALIDPNQDFAVRRRLARVFSVCFSERAANGVMVGLDDPRFDVRCQSARSLLAIIEKNPRIRLDKERIFDVVLREVTVGRPVWESRRLLDGFESESPMDEFVKDRAGESLAHVFTLLSLVLEKEPLQIAFRSLQTRDEYLRGTALEYLDRVLPDRIRGRLWPFLERRPVRRSVRPRQDVIADLMRSHPSVVLNLKELKRDLELASGVRDA
jgi:hypothetical protein